MNNNYEIKLEKKKKNIFTFLRKCGATMCGSRKYPCPPPLQDHWKFQGGGGGGSKAVIEG